MYKISSFEKSKKTLSILGKMISILICIIIIPIIIVNITLLIKSYFNPNEIPDILGFKTFVIVSKSMEPTIMTGDAIVVKEVNPEDLKVGDIISFRDGNSINTHRIVEIVSDNGKKRFRTKGDNNKNVDKELVTTSKVEGTYQLRIKGFGKVIKILNSKVTLVILLAFLILILIYEVRISKRKLARKEKRYEYNKKKYENMLK